MKERRRKTKYEHVSYDNTENGPAVNAASCFLCFSLLWLAGHRNVPWLVKGESQNTHGGSVNVSGQKSSTGRRTNRLTRTQKQTNWWSHTLNQSSECQSTFSCLHFTLLSPCLHFPKASTEYRLVAHQSAHELVIRDSKQGMGSKEDRGGEEERGRAARHRVTSHAHLFGFYRTSKCTLSGEKEQGGKKERWLTSERGWRQTKSRCSCASLWAWLSRNSLHWHRWRERGKEGKKEGEWWEGAMKRETGGLTQSAGFAL